MAGKLMRGGLAGAEWILRLGQRVVLQGLLLYPLQRTQLTSGAGKQNGLGKDRLWVWPVVAQDATVTEVRKICSACRHVWLRSDFVRLPADLE